MPIAGKYFLAPSLKGKYCAGFNIYRTRISYDSSHQQNCRNKGENMKKLLNLMTIFTIIQLMSGCGGGEVARSAATPTPAPSNKLAIIGSTTLLPVAQKAIEAFQKRKPEIKISLTGGGSLSGINGLVDGYADIAMSSRAMKNEEKDKMEQKRGTAAKETIVAWDGIIPIVHPSNPVKNLTIAQLKDIYTGKVADWGQVGGKKGDIIVVSRDFTSGTHEAWAELVLHNEPVVASAQEKSSSGSVLETVASTPNAIGYDGIGYVEGNKRVKRVSVEGQAASASSILDRSYKIARPLYLFTREKTNPTVVEFLDFVVSPEGQALIREAKFVPLSQRP
jgi:phosphate transport system substrate-binding protein